MARTRARDYDQKREAILAVAARIFAEHGYDRTPMSALASECGISKALLYHYYASKEALLFDIIDSHLTELVQAVESVDGNGADPDKHLEALVIALLDAYRDADAEHKVQLSALSTLPEPDREKLFALERRLVALFADAIRALNPPAFQGRALLKPVTMSLFGMLNWFYMWFREGGPMSREDYARLATHILVSGVTTPR